MTDQDRLKELSIPIANAEASSFPEGRAPDPSAPYLVRNPSFSDPGDAFTNAAPGGANVGRSWTNNNRSGRFSGTGGESGGGFRVVKDKCETAIVKMRENFNQMMERGNQIDNLVERSDTLNQTTGQFNSQARALENQMWWRRWLIPAVSVLVVTLLMVILCFLNRFVFWFLVVCMCLGLCSVIYFYAEKRNRQLNPYMPSEVAMAVV